MLNACELEIDLFCKGLRVPPDVPLEGARGISRTRAGLGSGLELALPAKTWLKDEIWLNAPVDEPFAHASVRAASRSRVRSSRCRRAIRYALPRAAAGRTRLVPLDDLA